MTNSRSWRSFIFSMVAVLLMVILQHLWPRPSLVTPQIRPEDPLELIRPKLEQKLNNFRLRVDKSLITSALAAGDYTQAAAFAAVDLDSGQVLIEQNLSQRLPIASLTKIMTAVVALDLATPDELFTVSRQAAEQIPTKLGLIPDQKLTLEELLNGLLLTSANDAAEVIAEGINQKYGSDVFVPAMNIKAKDLGLKNSHFANPQGLDGANQYSSVEDLTILSSYALKNYPLIAQIVQKDYQFYPASQNHKRIDMYNWNGLLGVYPGSFGVKIGNTESAGYTTIVGAKRAGKQILAIVLGAQGVLERDLWASQVLDIGFEKLANLEPAGITETLLKGKYATWKYWN